MPVIRISEKAGEKLEKITLAESIKENKVIRQSEMLEKLINNKFDELNQDEGEQLEKI